MKLIYKLIMISILLTLPVMSATMEEAQEIFHEVGTYCSITRTVCNIKLVDTDKFIASANINTIFISRGAIEFYPKDELRSVMYHELSHRLLNHNEQLKMKREDTWRRLERDMNYEEEQRIRHRVETEADSYASLILWLTQKPNRLDDALIRINLKSKRDPDLDSLTHPSLNKRLKNIRQLKVLYGN